MVISSAVFFYLFQICRLFLSSYVTKKTTLHVVLCTIVLLCLLYSSGPAADHPEGAAGGATQPSRHADRQPGKEVRVYLVFLVAYNL